MSRELLSFSVIHVSHWYNRHIIVYFSLFEIRESCRLETLCSNGTSMSCLHLLHFSTEVCRFETVSTHLLSWLLDLMPTVGDFVIRRGECGNCPIEGAFTSHTASWRTFKRPVANFALFLSTASVETEELLFYSVGSEGAMLSVLAGSSCFWNAPEGSAGLRTEGVGSFSPGISPL